MKGSSLLFVLVTLLLQNMLCPVAIAQSSVQQNSMTVSSDFLQNMPTEQLEAYFDSIYRSGHPHLDTILAEESTKPGKHPIKRQSTFSYSNNYVPSTASMSVPRRLSGKLTFTRVYPLPEPRRIQSLSCHTNMTGCSVLTCHCLTIARLAAAMQERGGQSADYNS